jgi:hypothetical protein
MPAGLRIWGASGALYVDTTSQLGRLYGGFTAPGGTVGSGSVQLTPVIGKGTAFAYSYSTAGSGVSVSNPDGYTMDARMCLQVSIDQSTKIASWGFVMNTWPNFNGSFLYGAY